MGKDESTTMSTPSTAKVSGFELHALTSSGLQQLSVAAATASVHELLDCLPFGVYSDARALDLDDRQHAARRARQESFINGRKFGERQAALDPLKAHARRDLAQHFGGDAFEHAVAGRDQRLAADEGDIRARTFEDALLLVDQHALVAFLCAQRQRPAPAHELGGLDQGCLATQMRRKFDAHAVAHEIQRQRNVGRQRDKDLRRNTLDRRRFAQHVKAHQ